MYRSNITKWAVKFLLAVLILSFALWGIGDGFRSEIGDTAIKFGDLEISQQEFRQLYNSQLKMLENNGYDDIATMAQSNPLLKHQVEKRVVEEFFIRNLAKEVGFIISDDMAKFEIAAMPSFQKDGQFDGDAFDRILKSANMQPSTFVQAVKDEMSVEQLSLLLNVVKPDVSLMARHLADARNQKLSLDIAQIDVKNMAVKAKATDADLAAVLEAHAAQFTIPEKRAFSAALLDYGKITGKAKVAPQEVRQYYNEHLSQFQGSQKRTVSQMVFKEEAEAKAALESLRAGESFASVAKKYFPKQKNFSLGEITQNALSPEIAEVIFSLSEGGISEAVVSPLGHHIFLVHKIIAPKVAEFDAVKSAIAEQMLLEARSKYFDKVSQDIEKDLSYGIALEDVAKKHDLPLIKAGVGQSHDLMKHRVFNDLVSQTEAGMTSQIAPLELSKQYVIVRVDELVPASLPAMDDIKPAVKAFWHHLQQKQEALALAQMITVGVAQGKNFDMICKANNIPVHRGVDVSKLGMYPWDSKLPMKVHQEAFSIPIKSITPYGATKAGDSYFVARVVGVKENKASQTEYEKTKLELEQSVVNDMLASAMAYYLEHEKIIVNTAK